jgi:hypothetical protein
MRGMEAMDLKRQLDRCRSAKRGRYPDELRRAVVAYAKRRKGERASRDVVAEELGMSVATLSYWCSASSGTIKPVAIVPVAREPARQVTVECGPIRVCGLDIEGVVELLRRLA